MMQCESQRKIDKNTRLINVVHQFLIEVATRVNQLLIAEDIDVHLYTQDDIDRQQTALYGLNEEVGKSEIKAKTPITVNSNCLQCSGNASYIKKAFKIACLTYGSTKVNYKKQEHSREDLLSVRKDMINKTALLSVNDLNAAIAAEQTRLQNILEMDRPAANFAEMLLNTTYDGKLPFAGAVLAESATSFMRDNNLQGMNFRDINNNSTAKLDDFQLGKVKAF